VALPIYTRLLTPADYGVIQLIEMTFDMLTILAGSRLAVGVFRFYHKADNNVDRRAVLTTALILLFTTFSIIAVAAWIAAPSLSRLIFRSDEFTGVIRIASLSFPWDGILGVPLAYLRLRDRAGAFVGIGLIKSLMQLVGVFILLAHFDMGVRGVFLSTLIANTLVGTALVTLLLRETGLRFSRQAGRDLFRFGMPLVVTQVATFFTTFGDRYFLQASAERNTGRHLCARLHFRLSPLHDRVHAILLGVGSDPLRNRDARGQRSDLQPGLHSHERAALHGGHRHRRLRR
jgi:O-antigen/teichoic acid export membrane protein